MMPCSVFLVIGADVKDGTLNLPGVVQDTRKGLAALGCRVTTGVVDDRTSITGIWRNIKRIGSEVASANPDIVHAQYGTVTAAVARLVAGRRPLVVTFRGDDLLGTPIPGLGWRVRERLAKWIGLWGAQNASAIIVMSENLRAALPGRLAQKATVLPFGVDLEIFKLLDRDECRARLGWDARSKVVLFNASSGTNQEVKNLPLARETIRLVAQSIPEVSLQILSGASRAKVVRMMNAADCLLVTSLHEGSPSIVREAMACNLPVVTVPCGDVAEQLRDAQPGSIQPYDAGALARALLQVLQSGARSNGRELVVGRRLTLEDVNRRLLDIYSRIQGETRFLAEAV